MINSYLGWTSIEKGLDSLEKKGLEYGGQFRCLTQDLERLLLPEFWCQLRNGFLFLEEG